MKCGYMCTWKWSQWIISCLSLNIPVQRATFISVYLPISFPMVHWLQIFSHHSCWCNASSIVKFLCFINLSTSFSHLILGCSHCHLPPSDQVVICLCHLLSSMHTCPNNFNKLFSSLSKILCYLYFFSDCFISYFQ